MTSAKSGGRETMPSGKPDGRSPSSEQGGGTMSSEDQGAEQCSQQCREGSK